MHQQIERTAHRQMIGGPTVEHVEIGYALLDETNDLGIHDRTAFDASSFLYNARVALRPVGAIHREQAHTTIANMDLQPIAVMLQFLPPTRPTWRLLGDDWLTRMNESGRRVHGPAARATPQHARDILQEQERSNSTNVIFRTAPPSTPWFQRGC